MTVGIKPLTKRKAWKALTAHYKAMRGTTCGSCLPKTRTAAGA